MFDFIGDIVGGVVDFVGGLFDGDDVLSSLISAGVKTLGGLGGAPAGGGGTSSSFQLSRALTRKSQISQGTSDITGPVAATGKLSEFSRILADQIAAGISGGNITVAGDQGR